VGGAACVAGDALEATYPRVMGKPFQAEAYPTYLCRGVSAPLVLCDLIEHVVIWHGHIVCNSLACYEGSAHIVVLLRNPVHPYSNMRRPMQGIPSASSWADRPCLLPSHTAAHGSPYHVMAGKVSIAWAPSATSWPA